MSDPLPDYLALAELIISRAGANAIHEFLALKKPMLLIPLPLSASRGDQILNAESFQKRGFARVLEEENITAESFVAAVNGLYDARGEYIDAMDHADSIDGTEKICEMIKNYLNRF